MRLRLLFALATSALAACGSEPEAPSRPVAPDTGPADTGSSQFPDSVCGRYCQELSACWINRGESRLAEREPGRSAFCEATQGGDEVRACIAACEETFEIQTSSTVLAHCKTCLGGGASSACYPNRLSNCSRECELTSFVSGAQRGADQAIVCWYGAETAPAACTTGPNRVWVNFRTNNNSVRTLSYANTATVVAVEPLELALADGSTLTVDIDDSNAPTFLVGQVFNFEIEILVFPEVHLTTFVVRRIEGSLIYATWETELPDVPEFHVDFRAAECASVWRDCGQVLTLEMIFSSNAGNVSVPHGQAQAFDGYVIANGASFSNSNGIFCIGGTGWRGGSVRAQ